MKTADSIAQQDERKDARGEPAKDQKKRRNLASHLPASSDLSRESEIREKRIKNIAPWQWKPGQSGNPEGGRESRKALRKVPSFCCLN